MPYAPAFEFGAVRHDRPDPPEREVEVGGVSRVGRLTGPPIVVVASGWFVPISSAARAHWHDLAHGDGPTSLRRLCDGAVFVPGELLEPGNFLSCKRCRRTTRRA